ncbi:MAG: T9SS type A sorting domain-containing protein [Chitinophagales bacterium]
MKNLITTTLICLLTGGLFAQVPGLEYEHSMGGKNSDFASDIISTIDGGLLMVGTAFSADNDITDHFGSDENSDIWITKLNADRSVNWSRSFGGTLSDSGFAVIDAGDNCFLIAGTVQSSDGNIEHTHGNSDGVLVKVNADGEIIWSHSYGTEEMEGLRSVVKYNDGFIAVGYSQSYNDLTLFAEFVEPTINNDAWIISVDVEGHLLYETTVGGSDNDYFNDVIFSTDNMNCIAVGVSSSTDGIADKQNGRSDVFAVAFSSELAPIWARCFGGSNFDGANAITQINESTFAVAGYAMSNDKFLTENAGGADIWVLQFDLSGEFITQHTFGGSDYEEATDIIQALDGKLGIAGFSRSADLDFPNNNGGSDYIIMETDLSGNIIFNKNFGGSFDDAASALIQFEDGTYMLAGSAFSNDGDVPGHISTTDYSDYWFVKVSFYSTYYADLDEDGFGDILNSFYSVGAPCHYVVDNTDCNDANSLVNPSGVEICNGIDDNCDGNFDEVLPEITIVPSEYSTCSGETINLIATPGFTIYKWYRNGILLAGVNSSALLVQKPGSYSVTGETGLCVNSSSVVEIAFYKRPESVISSPSTNLCTTPVVKLKANSGPDYHYVWYLNGVQIPGSESQVYYTSVAGSYNVAVTNAQGCTKKSAPVLVTNLCRTANEFGKELLVYPSPAADQFTVNVQLNDTDDCNINVTMYSINGEVIYSENGQLQNGLFITSVNLTSEVADGIYFLNIQAGNKILNQKIIIQH